jgi:hypothetical protein
VKGVEGTFENGSGQRLVTKSWPAVTPVTDANPVPIPAAIIVFCHGYVRARSRRMLRAVCGVCRLQRTHAPPLPHVVVAAVLSRQGHRVTDDEEYDYVADAYCRAGVACHGTQSRTPVGRSSAFTAVTVARRSQGWTA